MSEFPIKSSILFKSSHYTFRLAPFALVILTCGCAVFTKSPPAHFADVPISEAEPAENCVPSRLQAGDVVSVYLPVRTNDTVIAALDSEGWLALPRVGKVYLLGMTHSEAGDAIAEACRAKGIVPWVSRRPEHIRYFQVTGEVLCPGRRLYLAKTTLSKAIQAAGGAAKSANLRHLSIQRASGAIEHYNLLEEPHLDPLVFPGDTVGVEMK